jgi:hypothetical protein
MSTFYNCKVNAAGPADDGTETPAPVIYINLTDQSGSFAGYWFYARENSKSQMLAVALTAISLQATVQVAADPPNTPNNIYTQIYRLYVNAA